MRPGRMLCSTCVVVAGVAVAVPSVAPAVEIDLFGRLPQTRFEGSGCGVTDSASLVLPEGAKRVRRVPDFGIGTPLAGPYPFSLEGGAPDPEYATVTGFTTGRTAAGRLRATFTVTPSERWCDGYVGDPNQPESQPEPASEVENGSARPDYHAGWVTSEVTPYFRYSLVRSRLYSVDTRGRVRSRPPRSLAVSVRSPLVARELVWTRWGRDVAHARGVLRYGGRELLVFVELYNTDLGGDREGGVAGCPRGRVYYRHLYVSVPAWEAKTTYALGAKCRSMHVDNAAGDLRPG